VPYVFFFSLIFGPTLVCHCDLSVFSDFPLATAYQTLIIIQHCHCPQYLCCISVHRQTVSYINERLLVRRDKSGYLIQLQNYVCCLPFVTVPSNLMPISFKGSFSYGIRRPGINPGSESLYKLK
jgi:hypothetical protein